MMLYTIVELIHILSYIRTRTLLCCLCHQWILLNILNRLTINLPQILIKIIKISYIEVLYLLQLLLLRYVIIQMHHVILCFVNHVILCFVNLLCLVHCLLSLTFTNLLREFVDGKELRTTPIIKGGDDEDIAKMESRTTPIQEGEDDEDIAMLDMLTPSSFPSCNSSPTQLPRHSWIQQTCRQCFGHNFFIQHRNGVILNSFERGRRRRHFGSSPNSRSFVD